MIFAGRRFMLASPDESPPAVAITVACAAFRMTPASRTGTPNPDQRRQRQRQSDCQQRDTERPGEQDPSRQAMAAQGVGRAPRRLHPLGHEHAVPPVHRQQPSLDAHDDLRQETQQSGRAIDRSEGHRPRERYRQSAATSPAIAASSSQPNATWVWHDAQSGRGRAAGGGSLRLTMSRT